MTHLSERESELRRIKSSPPIFIFGSQRSGTSFLYRLVQRYLHVGFGRDNGHFLRFLRLLPCYGDLGRRENRIRLVRDIAAVPELRKKRFAGLHIDPEAFADNLEENTYAEIVRRFYAEWALQNGAARWGGKTPDYALRARELRELFPDARFIHIYRDGRDVALSLFERPWGPANAYVAAAYWKRRVLAARAFTREEPASCLEVRYEDLLAEPEREFRRILEHAGHTTDREAVLETFRAEVDSFFLRGNHHKWKKKMSAREVRDFEWAAGDLLAELGYEVVNPQLAGRPVPLLRRALFQADNAARKLLAGQGFKGLGLKAAQLARDLGVWLGRGGRRGFAAAGRRRAPRLPPRREPERTR